MRLTTQASGARPVTQQGLAGVRPATGSAGRQIYDRNFYLTMITGKIKELETEISK